MRRRDIVEKFINTLETLSEDRIVLDWSKKLVSLALLTNDHVSLKGYMDKVGKLDKERINSMVTAENYAGRAPHQGLYK